jgi:hypothetical protein
MGSGFAYFVRFISFVSDDIDLIFAPDSGGETARGRKPPPPGVPSRRDIDGDSLRVVRGPPLDAGARNERNVAESPRERSDA